ncbi:uncharacterized protein LOC144750578 [Ciona intestinalis]
MPSPPQPTTLPFVVVLLTILNKPFSSVQHLKRHMATAHKARVMFQLSCGRCSEPVATAETLLLAKGHWASCQGKRSPSSPKGGRSSPTPPANLPSTSLPISTSNLLPSNSPHQAPLPKGAPSSLRPVKLESPSPLSYAAAVKSPFSSSPPLIFIDLTSPTPSGCSGVTGTSSVTAPYNGSFEALSESDSSPILGRNRRRGLPLNSSASSGSRGSSPILGRSSLRPVPAPLTLCLSPPVAGPMISCEDRSAPSSVRSSSPSPNSPASVSSVEAHLSDLLDKVSSGELRPLSPTLPSSGFFGPLLPPTPPPQPTPAAEKASPSGLSYQPCRGVKIASIARPSPASQRVGCDADRTGPSLNPNYQQTSPPSTPSFSPIVRPPKFPGRAPK